MKRFLGRWRIEEMEVWDQDVLDLVVPAHITLDTDGLGSIQFIAIEAGVDYRVGMRDKQPAVEFSWFGRQEGDFICGRGWAILSDDTLTGRIYIHQGDDSEFIARRIEDHDRV
jgi:hypothetical protein